MIVFLNEKRHCLQSLLLHKSAPFGYEKSRTRLCPAFHATSIAYSHWFVILFCVQVFSRFIPGDASADDPSRTSLCPVFHATSIPHSHVHVMLFHGHNYSHYFHAFFPVNPKRANQEFPVFHDTSITCPYVHVIPYFVQIFSRFFHGIFTSSPHYLLAHSRKNLWICPWMTPFSSRILCALRRPSKQPSTENPGNSHSMIWANQTSAPTS